MTCNSKHLQKFTGWHKNVTNETRSNKKNPLNFLSLGGYLISVYFVPQSIYSPFS